MKTTTKLTVEEDNVWVKTFAYWICAGKTPAQADYLTWRNMQTLFPRLKDFDGCRAERKNR